MLRTVAPSVMDMIRRITFLTEKGHAARSYKAQ